MKNVLSKIMFLLTLSFALSSCASVGSFISDANIISIDQEKSLGVDMSSAISSEMKIVGGGSSNTLVQTLGSQLVQALPNQSFDYKFFVVEDNSPNAFTIPGGSIYVHTGLLTMASENEVAGVMAHEIGHAYERHPTKSLTRAYGLSYLSGLVLQGNQNQVKDIAVQIAQGSILSKYSRSDEYEADEIGYMLLQKADRPSDGLTNFLRKLQALEGGSSSPGFLSTHPPTPDRIKKLEALETSKG